MLAGFLAAYMSTIATNLNWGASYLVNDFYRRFWRPEAGEKELVRVSQLATVFLTLMSAVVTFNMDSITGAWKLLIVTGAGTGGVLLLRWYWWRINAWSEVSAMATAFVVSVAMQTVFKLDTDQPKEFAYVMLITVGITTAVWLAVTLMTKPEPDAVLESFYRKTHPSRFGWGPVADKVKDVVPDTDGWANIGCWLTGCVLIYGTLFGTGKLLLGATLEGLGYLALGVVSGWWILRDLNRRGWSSLTK
jgi:Na+/proline symporter